MITELSQKQMLALRRLVYGDGCDQAAWDAKVDLATVYRWIREDEAFKRELREARRDGCITARAILWKGVPAALELVRKVVWDGEMKYSMAIVRTCKLLPRLETAEAELAEGAEGNE
jgi:hypothetical protein